MALKAGFAMCGSFCTFSLVFPVIEQLVKAGVDVLPIMSENAYSTDTRFGTAREHIQKVEQITGKQIIHTIAQAEPIGPKKLVDALVIAPCTGNTLAKLAAGIADTPVTLAAKSSLRNSCPLVIAVSTNDALSGAAKNIGQLLNMKSVYFVPFAQDDAQNKPRSCVADFDRLYDTLMRAVVGRQLEPILLEKRSVVPI